MKAELYDETIQMLKKFERGSDYKVEQSKSAPAETENQSPSKEDNPDATKPEKKTLNDKLLPIKEGPTEKERIKALGVR